MKELNGLEAYNALPADAGPGNNAPGIICAANEARFTSSNFSTPLTAYAAGWQDPEQLDRVLDRIVPPVDAARRFEFKRIPNSEAFYSEDDDIRAIGAAFKRVEFKGESVNEKTINKGLTVRVDHDDTVGNDWRERTVARLQGRLVRNDLRRAMAIIDAAATNQAVTWASGTPNPDKNLRDAMGLSADATGLRPNVIVFGDSAWDIRKDAYEALNTPYAGRAAAMSPEELARAVGADLVEILRARYQNTASAKLKVLANLVYTYVAIQGAGKDDPSAVKRFVTPARGGRWGVYVQEHEKFTDISVEHYSNIVVTGGGIRKLTVS